jgi:hypothetical protein
MMWMPKANKTHISEKDLNEYLASESDFAFEMKVLSLLRKLGCTCSHGGTYEDPIAHRIRLYDIRAEKVDSNRKLLLAVECKNIRPNFPLLLNAVPRTTNEAFHEIISFREGSHFLFREVQRIGQGRSIYQPHKMVGKRTDQVGRTIQGADLFSDDSLTFDKISQAINSSKDIFIGPACESGAARHRMVVPVLIVPTDMLWQVDYDHDGDITKHPYRIDEATLFIDHLWTESVTNDFLKYRISHLHIVTIRQIERTLKMWMGPAGFFAGVN